MDTDSGDAHDLDDGTARAVLDAGLRQGGEFAEIFLERRRRRAVRLDDRRIEDVSGGYDAGAGVRVVRGRTAGYAYTNVLTREALVEAATTAAAAVAGDAEGRVADLTTVEPPLRHPARLDPLAADGPAIADLLRRAEDTARSYDGSVVQFTARYATNQQDILIANSDGHRSTERRVRLRLAVRVVAARDGMLQVADETWAAARGLEALEDRPPEQLARTAAERAVLLLDAEPAPAGELPVVLAPGSGGVLFHEACGHGMEADIVAKQASVYRGRQGERIGSPVVSVVDDATLPGHWGSVAFDDEGTPAQRTVLFDRGVCGDYLTDRLRAAELGLPRSGNARRESYAYLPLPRMTNTFVVPGEDDPDEIVAGVDRGLYCDALGGGQVDPASGEFVFGISLAHMIEGGEISRPVRGASLVGDGPTVLARVDAVAGDFDVRQGICGKDGQGVPAELGNPTLRIARITVGGKGS